MWRMRGAAVVAGVVLAVAGCGSATGGHRPPATGMADLGVLVLQPPELGEAEALVLQRCLREHGFDAPRPRAVSGSAPNLPVPLDPAAGYGDVIDRGHPDVLGEYAQQLPDAARVRFAQATDDSSAAHEVLGTPDGWQVSASTGGCVAQARAEVYGSVRGWLAAVFLPQDLNAESGEAGADPRVGAVLTAYAGCMSRRGHDVTGPADAVDLARRRAAPGLPPSAWEVALAADDAVCRAETGLVQAYLTVLGEKAGGWLAANADLVRDTARLIEQSTVRARAIVAASRVQVDGTSNTASVATVTSPEACAHPARASR